MQVFKVFFKVLSKNKMSLIIYIAIYLSITILISNVTMQTGGGMDFSKSSVKIGVENEDEGILGEALTEYLTEHNEIQKVPADREALQDAMYYREIEYVLLIPEDFTEKFAAGERDNLLEGTVVSGSSASYLVETEMEQFLRTTAMYLEGGFGIEQAVESSLEDMKLESEVSFLEEEDAQVLGGEFYYFQYLAYVFLCMMIIGIGSVLKVFKNKDLDARNKCSAMSFFSRNVQMILGSMVYMLFVYACYMVMACFFCGDYMWSVKGVLSAINALIFITLCLSVAYFAGNFAKNTAELNLVSNIFGLGFSFLGGVFVSLDIMSDGVKKVSKFIPSYWYVTAHNEIQKVKGFADAGKIYQCYLIVLVFALAFFAAGMLVNRMKTRAV